jgi:hypothetical protein
MKFLKIPFEVRDNENINHERRHKSNMENDRRLMDLFELLHVLHLFLFHCRDFPAFGVKLSSFSVRKEMRLIIKKSLRSDKFMKGKLHPKPTGFGREAQRSYYWACLPLLSKGLHRLDCLTVTI